MSTIFEKLEGRELREHNLREDHRLRPRYKLINTNHRIDVWGEDAVNVADELDTFEVCKIIAQEYDNEKIIGKELKIMYDDLIDDVVNRI